MVGLVAALAAACSSSSGGAGAATHPTASAGGTPASASPGTGLARFTGQHPDWKPCGGRFQCATVSVPLDYARPAGRTISLAVIRLPATGPGPRIGSLFVNPGGPGVSGVDFARSAQLEFPAALRARFDIVGFDPRGVAGSTAVHCVSDAQLDHYVGLDPVPDTTAEKSAIVDTARAFATACEQRSGWLLPHVGTLDAARDMDVLRAVVGDSRLSYFGASYGTYLGAKYAQLFPTHIRALVLDGALDPTQDTTALNAVQAAGFSGELGDFLTACVHDGHCPLGATVAQARADLDRLAQQVDAQPIRTLGGRSLGPGEFFNGLAAGLYSPQTWPQLEQGLQQVADDHAGILLQFSDALSGRGPDGHYDNEIAANNAINCIDRPSPRDVAAYETQAAQLARTAPLFGPAIAYGSLTCAFWPVPPVDGTEPVHAPGSPPILVVGTTRDPATPYRWAQALARQLDHGVLLTYQGDGHTAYGRNRCIDDTVDTYLLTTTPPKAGTVCS